MEKANYDVQYSQYPCQVWVAAGEYKPANPGGVFYLRSYTNVYGGFEGDEPPQTMLNQRDWRGHPTVLTGNSGSPHIIYANGTYAGGAMGQPSQNYGGGIDLYGAGHIGLSNLIITGNQADKGGGIYIVGGGIGGLSPVNDMVYGNIAGEGGGIFVLGNDSVGIVNSVFAGNQGNGRAIHNDSANIVVVNSTFYHDDMVSENSHLNIENSIFFGGLLITGDLFTKTTISYSIVQGCNPGGSWQDNCGSDGGHNLPDADPLFSDFIVLNFHLFYTSPMINRGNNSYSSGATDMDGNPRIAPAGGTIDLGAHEYQPTLPSLQAFTKYGVKDHPIVFRAADFNAHFSVGNGTGLSKVKIISLQPMAR